VTGTQLQDWMYQARRPLVWADDDGVVGDGNMVIDPKVGQLALPITPEMGANFSSLWSIPACGKGKPAPPHCLTFAQLKAATHPMLHMRLPDYRNRAICAPFDTPGSPMHIMGTNEAGGCVYWVYESPPNRWECLNDGTCEQSLGGRGTFSTQADCEKNCGQGKWACMQNAIIAGCAGADATMCIPSPTGACKDITTCENFCSA